MRVRNLLIFFTFLTTTFVFTPLIHADGDHDSHSELSNAISNFQRMDTQTPNDSQPQSEETHNDAQNLQSNHTDEHSNNISGHSDSGHGEESHEDEGHSNVIEEVPPNYKVLGTFGLINLSFLSLGVVLKIRKRKETSYETRK